MNQSGDNQVLDRLFDAYAENRLTESQCVELERWLEASVSHVHRFVHESLLHWQLFDILRGRSLHRDVMTSSVNDSALGEQLLRPDVGAIDQSAAFPRRSPKLRFRWVMALAACLVLAAGIGAWSFLGRPETVAQLTKLASGASLQSADSSVKVGALLHAGQTFYIRSGRILATLVSGTRVIIDGPAEFELAGPNRVRLLSGRLGADVPTQATGFIVDTPLAQFVDLGTKFTLIVQPTEYCELHVFVGLVKMQPAQGDRGPVRVSEGRAVHCDARTGDVTLLPYDDRELLSL